MANAKTYAIHWQTLGGNWRRVDKREYGTRAAAVAVLKTLGLYGNPAYRVVEWA